ncbi:hypothetical protein KHA80_01195 [Anaerobacillus sp. HL2]|nr:hypothetical protein KHA80_01195 [Anaerobacillus sp. HL2]
MDIPGEDLSCLIIVRLPFHHLTIRSLKRKVKNKRIRKNPFMDLSLPQAIIRFKQGFGRLIRSSHDRGAVFIFDRRITGRAMVNSLFIQSTTSSIKRSFFARRLRKLVIM